MSSFLRKLCCCGSKATSPVPVRSSAPAARNSNPNPNRNSGSRHQSQQIPHVSTSHERRRSQQPPKVVRKFLKLKSSYSIDTVKVADTRSDEMKDLKFNCPICFRFFDRILVSSCCSNYLCHFCAHDVNEKVKKDDKTPIARCPFCNSEDFELTDVDPNEKPKKYTDSFYSTFKSNGKGPFNNKLALKAKDQLYMTGNKSDFEQDLVGLEVNRMAKSDGVMYMHKALEIERERMGNTVGADSLSPDRIVREKDFIRIMPDDRIVGDDLQRSGTDIEERKSNASSDSLNERAPIDIIPEDEFESSVVPEVERRMPE